MTYARLLAPAIALFLSAVMSASAAAQEPAPQPEDVYAMDFDTRLSWCKSEAARDPETTYEMAMVWKSQGGGRRALDCAAFALSEAGEPGLAAELMDELGADITAGPPRMRTEYYAQGVEYWLAAMRPQQAFDTAMKAVEITPDYPPARIAQARAYGGLGDWQSAQNVLTANLRLNPDHGGLLAERAKARYALGDYETGLLDAESALDIDLENLDAALIRGQLREAMRLKAEAAAN